MGYFPDLMQSRRSYQALKKFLDATYHFLEHDPFQNKLGGIGIVKKLISSGPIANSDSRNKLNITILAFPLALMNTRMLP